MSCIDIFLILSLLPLVLSNMECSVSFFTRKRCRINAAIGDSAACVAAGCCFDPSPGVPNSGKCYKKGMLQLGGFGLFNPTVPPSPRENSGILSVGGEPGFPGSEIIQQCNPIKLCLPSGFYNQNQRADCIRQGCCWRLGRCYQQTILILRLRSACPPGFKDPPACDVHNPCTDTPSTCKNGGVCTFTGPGKFSCACPTGFSGTTCNPNCKRDQLTIVKGKVTPEQADYVEGQQVALSCETGATSQAGAKTARLCLNGEFTPKLSTDPFTCSSDCAVEAVSKAGASTTAATVTHGVDVTYTCDAGTTSASANVLTRKCTNGHLMPLLSTTPIVCDSDCTVEKVDNAEADKTALKHGESVTYSCSATFSSTTGQTLTRKCENGVLTPSLSTDKIVCSSDCTVTAPDFSTANPSDATVKHGAEVTFACQATHAGSAAAETKRTCDNGNLVPDFTAQPYICSKNCKLTQIDNAETMPAVVIHGNEVELKCLATHTALKDAVSKRTCDKGVLVPDLTSKPFTCHKTCTVDAVTDASSVPTKGSPLAHLAQVTYECADKHTYQVGAQLTRTCKEGNLDPPLSTSAITCSAQCKITNGGANTQSSITIDTYINHDATVDYNCISATHSSLSTAKLTRTCKDGKLTPDLITEPIQCFPHCTTPETLTSGTFTVQQTSYPLGTEITYSCNPKFTHGSTDVLVRKCGQSGNFEPTFASSPITCSSDCINPPAVPGAHVVTSQPIHNTKSLTYKCDTDYVQEPTSLMARTCTNGEVLPDPNNAATLIKCYQPCTFTTPSDAKVTTAAPYLHGSKVTVTCNAGWTTPAGATPERDCVDGKLVPDFTKTPYTCSKDCGVPTTVVGASFTPSASGKYHHGDKVNYVCDAGSTTTDVTERTCTNGEFLPTQAITCHANCEITGVFTQTDHNQATKTHIKHGESVKYTCKTGFSNPSLTVSERTCDNGRLTPDTSTTKFECSADCTPPTAIDHGTFTPATTVKHTESITFECDPTDYTSLSTATLKRTCDNGKYDPDFVSSPLQCYKNCVPETLTNGDHTPKETKYAHTKEITYQCNNKFSSVTATELKRTCTNGAFKPTLTEKAITCLEDCDVPTRTKATTNPTGTTVSSGTTVTYTCEDGWSAGVGGTTMERKCTAGKLDPEMSGATDVKCYKSCAKPTASAEQTIEPATTETSYPHGTELTYSCSNKYSLQRGASNKKKCENGNFVDATVLVCHQECDPIKKPDNGQVVVTYSPILEGDTAVLSCDDKFSYPSTAKTTLKCTGGAWSPTYAASNFVCNSDCETLPDVTGSEITPTQTRYKHGDSIVISCKSDSTLVGKSGISRVCTKGGYVPTLLTEPAECKKKCKVETVAGGETQDSNGNKLNVDALVDHDITVTLKCNAGWTALSGAASARTCSNGAWNLAISAFKCNRNCQVTAPTDGSIKQGKTEFTHLEKVDFECAAKHTLVGTAAKTCENGQLDPTDTVECKKQCEVKIFSGGAGSSSAGTMVDHMISETFRCNNGYTTSHTLTRKCVNGNFDPAVDDKDDPLKCYGDCTVPATFTGIQAPASATINHNQQITYVCANTHTMDATSEATRTCHDGRLDPAMGTNDPQCWLKCTSAFPTVKYATSKPTAAPINHGDTVVYECDSKYHHHKNDVMTRTCKNGDLDPPIDDKKPINCYLKCDVIAVEHATADVTTSQILSGETVVYTCATTHTPTSDASLTRTCGDGSLYPGLDVKPILCKEKCVVTAFTDATSDPATSEKVNHGHTVKYTCSDNHKTPGGQQHFTVTCEDGTLKNFEVCHKQCQVPALTDGSATPAVSKWANHLEPITFKCNDDFSTPDTVIRTCKEGKLDPLIDSKKPLKCYRDCKTFTSVGNAQPNPSTLPQQHGVEVTWSCTGNYNSLPTASMKSTCNNGNFDMAGIECFAKCQITTTNVKSPAATGSWVDHSETVDHTFECITNYAQDTGNNMKRKCIRGNWSPLIDGSDPMNCRQKCLVPSISQLKTPVPGNYVAHSSSTSVTFVCNDNHKEKKGENMVRKCEEGVWNPAISSPNEIHCDPMCQVTFTLAQGSSDPALNQWVENEDTVTYSCAADHSSSDTLVRTCKMGNWDPPIAADNLKCTQECEVPVIANLKSPVSGSKKPHAPSTDVTFVCNDNHKKRKNENLVRRCDGGKWSPLIASPNEIHCDPMCQVTFNLDQGSSNPALNQWVENDDTVTYSCTGHYSTTDTLVRTCKMGNWDPPIAANNLKCWQKCLVPSISQLKTPVPGNYADHSTSTQITFVCNDNHSPKPGENMIRKCEEGSWKPLIAPPNEIHCVKNDPDADIFFVYSHDTSVDDCSGIIAAQGGASFPPFSLTQLSGWSKVNFNAQLTAMKGIESGYVSMGATKTRFGVLSNQGTTKCGATNVQRALGATEITTLTSLFGSEKYECEAKKFSDLLICVYDHGFKGNTRTGKNLYTVYFTATSTETLSHITTMAGNIKTHGTADQKAALEVFTFVIDTRPKTDAAYTTSKNLFESYLATDGTKPIKGAFIGSAHDGATALLTEMRKHIS